MQEGKKFSECKKLEYSSVQKAIHLLLSFIPENEAVGNLQLSKSLGLNKSTVSRLMQVLLHYGLIQQDPVTKKYELGRTAALLGMAVETSQVDRLAQIGQPYLDQLRDRVGESVCLEVLETGRVRVIAESAGPPPLSASFPQYLPLHVAAGAKVILAFSEKEYIDSVLPESFDKLTENTIVDVNVFKEQLDEIAKEGIAFDFGEVNVDVHTMSAAVFNHQKKPVAAVCVCVPTNRIGKLKTDEYIDMVKKTAIAVSERLFYDEKDEA